jgi:hypothetical protein
MRMRTSTEMSSVREPQYYVYQTPMERLEEQERIQARMQEFAVPYSKISPAGIDVNILELHRD